jgi:pSer/pThr/pTyr-binding forkhead associated (FHA) protein
MTLAAGARLGPYEVVAPLGTFHNGRRIESPVVLGDGDEIRLGSLGLQIHRLTRAPSTETAGGV